MLIFSPHLTWYSDSLKGSAVSLAQRDKTKSQQSLKRKRSYTKQKCFSFIVKHWSQLHHTSTNQRKMWQFWVAYIQMFKFQAMKIWTRTPTQCC